MPFTYNPFTGKLDKVSVDTTIVSGIAAHSDLDDLDYSSSGHIGFQPTGDYSTNAQLASISGSIVSQIPSLTGYATENHVTTVSGDIVSQIPTDFDDRYYTESEITTISGDIVAQIPSLTGYATESYVSTNYIDNSEITTISGDITAQIPSAYTNEMAQDAVGTIMSGIGSVVVTYNDFDNTITISGSDIGGISSIVEDTTPELGGDMNFNGYTISGTGHIITGDHSTISGSYEVVNVMYGTSIPTISGVPVGTLYIVYEV
ncbi:MAG: hypothetical protein WC169_11525 [Dehalococcoidia bacterium]|jgi:hypothetical protein